MGAELRLPVFVYGTLRRGEANHSLLAGRFVASQPAVLHGHALYVQRIPFAVETPGGRVVGELFTVAPHHYDSVIEELDELEGYRPAGGPSRYERVRCTAHVAAIVGETTQAAWVYVAGLRVRRALREVDRVGSGDWLDPRVR